MQATGATHKDAATRAAAAALEGFLASGERLRFEPEATPAVSVLLVLHGRAELTRLCLESLRGTAAPFEVVIVDNASTDATAALLERIDGATLARNPSNLGFLRAANQAAALARGTHLLFLNNDCELQPGSLDAALERLNRGDGVGAVVGRLVALDGRLQEAGSIVWSDGSCAGYGRGDSPEAPEYMFERDVDYGSGAFLLTPRELFLGLGGFDDAYAPAYYEDADYALRLWQAGHRVVYEPRALARHYEFASAASMEEALSQQAARRATFRARHAAALERQHAPGVLLAARARPGGPRVLLVDDRVPHEALGQGYPRALELIAGLRRLGCVVTHYPLLFPTEDWESVYASLPRDVEVVTGRGPGGFEAFRRERAGYYDLAIVSRPSTRRALGDGAPFGDTPWIYDAEALEADREQGRLALRGEAPDAAEWERRRAAEVALARGARAVACVSETEAAAFRAAGHRVAIVGHALAVDPGPRSFDERSGMLFAGAVTDDASPNADALAWFVTEVMPRIAALRAEPPTLTIAGVLRSPRVTALLGERVRHVGAVASLAPLYDQARLFVAPVRFGAGLPMKAHQAAAHGLPMVATEGLAGQLGWRDGEELLVGRDADAFARACVALDRDAERWRRLRDAALARVARDCGREAFDRGLSEALGLAAGGPRAPIARVPVERARSLAPARLPDDRADRTVQLETALAAARHDLTSLRSSMSWRLTAPLRALHRLLRGRP